MKFGFRAALRAPMQDSKVVDKKEMIENVNYESGKILQVYSTHGLFQAIGYMKYKASQEGYGIAYRGQANLHSSLCPSLYRKITPDYSRENCDADFDARIKKAVQETKDRAEKCKHIVLKEKDSVVYDDLYKFDGVCQ